MKLETILCIEDKVLSQKICTSGFIPTNKVNPKLFLAPEYLWFAPRAAVEYREDLRQIIPYVILRYKDSIAIYARTQKGGEKRLHGRLSVGFGGHVGLGDAILDGAILDVDATLTRAVYRELGEEVKHSPVDQRDLIGLIYDHTDAVSRVHLGVIEMWTLSKPIATSSELSICECQFVSLNHLGSYLDRMEGWSRLCTSFLVEAVERAHLQ